MFTTLRLVLGSLACTVAAITPLLPQTPHPTIPIAPSKSSCLSLQAAQRTR